MKFGTITALMLGLSACQTEVTKPADCGAGQLQDLVGQDAAALDGRAVRLIPPGTAITKDYRLDRLNADLDGSGEILRLWCG